MLQLEDNIWDEFGASATDDHIVPRTVDEYRAQFKIQGDGRTKPQHEVIGVARNADNTAKYGILSEKRKGIHTLTKNKMLEKCPWSHSSDGIFPTSGDNDSLKEVTGMVSDDPMVSSQGLKIGDIDSVSSDFCAEDPVLVDNWAIEDNNIYRFPLNHMSDTNGDLRFFNNNHEDKENCDLLCYAWGDIGNFEDVDRMFRSCDSTFGLGSLSNEDDLCWVSSSHATEGFQDVLKADAKLNSLPEHCATSRPDNVGLSTIDSYKKNVLPRDKISSLDTSGDNPGLADMSSLDVSNKESEIKDDLTPTEQQFVDVKHPFTDSSCQLFSPLDLQQHKQNTGPDSVSYGQASVPYMHHNNSGPSNQISRFPTLTSAKSEINEHPSTNGSSCASSQAQSVESFGMGKPFHQQDTKAPVNGNINQARVESQIAFYDPVTVQKQVCQSEQDEDHSEVEGFSESSCVGSMLDEVSLEATSFRQLQQDHGKGITDGKLDIRTKLCIQDSLYRLGRTAEQRHNCTDTKNGIRDDEDASGPLVAEETNKCTRFMDIETDTNPIDRSTAHLLFHRSSDPSLRPATDTASLKSHGMIHGSPTARPASAEKQIDHEENGAVSDNNR
ncbi:hypothetical protein ERO13_A13G066101v2 [Gossypium hirsutum]|nr:hypothetical protein ERO13_A13G066101v2 [Gossypium hirsutum]